MNTGLIENRYEKSADGRLVIDIAVDSIGALYNDFDKQARFRKRELDQDFVDYLIECVEEIKGNDYMIRVSMPEQLPQQGIDRIRSSIRNFFLYLTALERIDFRRDLKKTCLLFLFGILLIFLSLFGPFQEQAESGPTWIQVLHEGTVIAAWVSMWEGITTMIFDWQPHYHKIRLYRGISESEVEVLRR